VDATRVRTMAGQTSGHAWITVTDDGENTIVVVPGANAALDRECAAAVDDFPSGSVLLCQLEVPLDVVHAAARTAEAHGVRLILNASPSATVPPDLLALCDPLVVNHREATRLLGRDLPDAEVPRDASDLSAELLGMGARSVVVTLGAAGAAWHDPNGYLAVPAPRVRAVDTTGAGDAFAGTLAAQLLRATSAEQALAAAVAAGSEATTWQGAHG
jgi:ribokinase